MNRFQLKVDRRSLRQVEGSIKGRCCILFDGKSAPTAGWVDDVVDVVADWCLAMTSLSDCQPLAVLGFRRQRCRILVMKWIEGDTVSLTLLGPSSQEIELPLGRLRSLLFRASTDLLQSCALRGFVSPEVERLAHGVAALRGEKADLQILNSLPANPSAELPRGKLKIVVDPSSLEFMEGGGNVWGRIEVQGLGGTPFPAAGWADFVVPVLSWWCESLGSSANDLELLYFMDGHYRILIEKHGPDQLVVERVHGGAGFCIVNAREFRTETLRAARAVVQFCSEAGWQSEAIGQLAVWADALQESLE